MKSLLMLVSLLFITTNVFAGNAKKPAAENQLEKPSGSGDGSKVRINLSDDRPTPSTATLLRSPVKTPADEQQNQMSKALELILSKIDSIDGDFGTDIEFTDDAQGKFLEINSLFAKLNIRFNGDIVYPIEKSNDKNIQKVAPEIVIATKDMWLVGEASSSSRSRVTLKFCYSYSKASGACNQDENKLLELRLQSKTLKEVIKISLKQITLDVTPVYDNKKLKKYTFSGSCEAFHQNAVSAGNSLKPVQCEFNGHYSSDKAIGTKVRMKYNSNSNPK